MGVTKKGAIADWRQCRGLRKRCKGPREGGGEGVNGDWEGCSARQTGWGGRAGDGRRGSDDEERVEVWGGEGEIRGGGGKGRGRRRGQRPHSKLDKR